MACVGVCVGVRVGISLGLWLFGVEAFLCARVGLKLGFG